MKNLSFTVLQRWLAGMALLVAVLFLVVLFFPWNWLREPINRYVSDQLGRRFEITRHLSVDLGATTTIKADGVEFANPEWASEPYLVKARSAEFDIRLWPLLSGRIELPRVLLTQPQIGLQMDPDGRRSWVLSRNTSDTRAVPEVGVLMVDEGSISYRALAQGADVRARFSIEPEATGQLPLSYKASGKWRNEAFTASGRTGGVLALGNNPQAAFPLEIKALSGKTSLTAKGTVSGLAGLTGLDASFDIQGRNLEELYRLLGVVLPSTPPYKLRGKISRQGQVWSASQIQGVLGATDMAGQLSFDTSGARPLLKGKVQSRVLDFVDLRPVIGLPVKGSVAARTVAKKGAGEQVSRQAAVANGRVLPSATLDLVRLRAMDADVMYSAADIRHVEQLPLDSGSVHVRLTQGVLQLEPITLGVAGGSVAGRIVVDSNVAPAVFEAKLALHAMQINKLFPTLETTKSSFGKVSGQVDLKGRGNSMAQMLASASGDVAVLTGRGELSNILLEFVGLDGGEIIKFLLRGDRNVQLRCAAAAFDVKQGLMRSKTIVLDTSDTLVTGSGQINLARETLDLVFKPQPKDASILSLRSPLRIGGTFASPTAGPDKLALAGRGALALALGLVNPLLALAATVETGPGQDADCRSILAAAASTKTGTTKPGP